MPTVAEETGKLRTWGFSIDDHSLRPLVCFVLTLDPSPTRMTINARTDRSTLNLKCSRRRYTLNGRSKGP